MAITALNQISDSIQLDVNTLLDINGKPDLLPDVEAINNSLFNLFMCPVGSRGAIFEPEYGTNLIYLLQEPLDETTAQQIQLFIVQAIQRWEPRVIVDFANTVVQPDYANARFVATIAYSLVGVNTQGSLTMAFSAG